MDTRCDRLVSDALVVNQCQICPEGATCSDENIVRCEVGDRLIPPFTCVSCDQFKFYCDGLKMTDCSGSKSLECQHGLIVCDRKGKPNPDLSLSCVDQSIFTTAIIAVVAVVGSLVLLALIIGIYCGCKKSQQKKYQMMVAATPNVLTTQASTLLKPVSYGGSQHSSQAATPFRAPSMMIPATNNV